MGLRYNLFIDYWQHSLFHVLQFLWSVCGNKYRMVAIKLSIQLLLGIVTSLVSLIELSSSLVSCCVSSVHLDQDMNGLLMRIMLVLLGEKIDTTHAMLAMSGLYETPSMMYTGYCRRKMDVKLTF